MYRKIEKDIFGILNARRNALREGTFPDLAIPEPGQKCHFALTDYTHLLAYFKF